MIIVRLNGGLGNQLFQFAAGFALANLNQDTLKLDLSGYGSNDSKNTYRRPDLLKFNIGCELATSKEVESFRNRYGVISKVSRVFNQRILKRYYHDWHPEIMKLKGDVYLDGYFQSDRYFCAEFDELSKRLTLNDNLLKNASGIQNLIKGERCPVSVHIRRGDYVNNPKTKALHDICTLDYFYKAIDYFRGEFGDMTLVVFSDDIEWVKTNFQFEASSVFVSDMYGEDGDVLSGPEELFLMSCCDHNIISNSTFSWWGAYLNPNKNKKVVAPSLWNRSVFFKHQNITPGAWVRLPV